MSDLDALLADCDEADKAWGDKLIGFVYEICLELSF